MITSAAWRLWYAFLETPGNVSGLKSYLTCTRFITQEIRFLIFVILCQEITLWNWKGHLDSLSKMLVSVARKPTCEIVLGPICILQRNASQLHGSYRALCLIWIPCLFIREWSRCFSLKRKTSVLPRPSHGRGGNASRLVQEIHRNLKRRLI